MKILIFEYITGGGFNKEPLPESLANEGLLMLRALLDGLTALPGLELTVMLDWRLADSIKTTDIDIVVIDAEHACHEQFIRLAKAVDAVWPIAPEFNGILLTLSRSVERLGKILLGPSSEAVALTADKFRTFQCLRKYNIPTVSTRLLADCREYPGESMIKSVDGVGCADSYLVKGPEDFALFSDRLRNSKRHIVQPHLIGEKTSLSCLFKQGKVWLLSANLQKFTLVDNQYHLSEIVVNDASDLSPYQALSDSVAKAVPGLWGYAGVDLIETSGQTLVLEINPRLTTSFAGIGAALGINAAGLVLQLLQGEPVIERKADRKVTVKIEQNSYEC